MAFWPLAFLLHRQRQRQDSPAPDASCTRTSPAGTRPQLLGQLLRQIRTPSSKRTSASDTWLSASVCFSPISSHRERFPPDNSPPRRGPFGQGESQRPQGIPQCLACSSAGAGCASDSSWTSSRRPGPPGPANLRRVMKDHGPPAVSRPRAYRYGFLIHALSLGKLRISWRIAIARLFRIAR